MLDIAAIGIIIVLSILVLLVCGFYCIAYLYNICMRNCLPIYYSCCEYCNRRRNNSEYNQI